jgi:hypothetical protein
VVEQQPHSIKSDNATQLQWHVIVLMSWAKDLFGISSDDEQGC